MDLYYFAIEVSLELQFYTFQGLLPWMQRPPPLHPQGHYLNHYPKETPVAIGYRVGWKDQFIKIVPLEKMSETSIENNAIFKSAILIRFLILIILVDTLFFNKIINLKKFFLFSLFCTSFVSFDIILQYLIGTDLFGFKSVGGRYAGPYGDEAIAGGFLQRFSFFSFFAILIFLKDNKLKNPLLILLITLQSTAMLFAGNRMSFLLFLFGCGLTIIFVNNFIKRKNNKRT